jgi:hypothetical protein
MKNWLIKMSLNLLLMGAMQPLVAQFILPPVTAEATDLALIKTAYNKAGVVSCKMTYQLYAPSANTAADSMTGNLTLSGGNYHFKIAHFEYLQQGSRLLYVDHEAREMLIYTAAKNQPDGTNAGQLATILDRQGVATSIQNLGGNRRKLTFDAAQAGVQNVEMWYNTDTYFIERTRTVMPQTNGILEVKYGQFNREKSGFKYAISSFAVLKNKKYEPTGKYKGYTVKVMD